MSGSRFITGVAAVLASVAIAACGDDTSEDETQIAAAIESVATGGDPAACAELQTQRFVEQVVGEGLTGDAALEACEQNADRGVAESTEVTEIEIDGDRATANAAITGSTFDGQTLALALIRDGEQWKLDEFVDFAVFDRDRIVTSLTGELESEGVPEKTVECVGEQFAALSDEEVRHFFLTSDPEIIGQVFGACE